MRLGTLRPRAVSKLLLRRRPLQNQISRRNIVAAPKPGSGPLLERRSDRALPSIRSTHRWLRTLPVFFAILGASALGIFNYQKSSSSVVSSTLYALRTNPRAREVLGDEIYFANKMPWIWGELNQLHGKIDIQFRVKGTKGQGMMRFRSERRQRMGFVRLFKSPSYMSYVLIPVYVPH
ncbi:MAG: hypothetical protein M1825_005038 [Sarcosagium campestre]|nr:MAG: hypothetical protein M1825_005038 [Sarcosagium campestre]